MLRVLLLDDCVWSREAIRAMLQPQYRVMAVATPEEALRIWRSKRPNLFIADHAVGGASSGIHAICRAHVVSPTVPLLVVSTMPVAYWQENDVNCFERLMQAARLGFLEKPFCAERLRAEVAGLVYPRGICHHDAA